MSIELSNARVYFTTPLAPFVGVVGQLCQEVGSHVQRVERLQSFEGNEQHTPCSEAVEYLYIG